MFVVLVAIETPRHGDRLCCRTVNSIYDERACEKTGSRDAIVLKFLLRGGLAGCAHLRCGSISFDVLNYSYAVWCFRSMLKYAFTDRHGVRRKLVRDLLLW